MPIPRVAADSNELGIIDPSLSRSNGSKVTSENGTKPHSNPTPTEKYTPPKVQTELLPTAEIEAFSEELPVQILKSFGAQALQQAYLGEKPSKSLDTIVVQRNGIPQMTLVPGTKAFIFSPYADLTLIENVLTAPGNEMLGRVSPSNATLVAINPDVSTPHNEEQDPDDLPPHISEIEVNRDPAFNNLGTTTMRVMRELTMGKGMDITELQVPEKISNAEKEEYLVEVFDEKEKEWEKILLEPNQTIKMDRTEGKVELYLGRQQLRRLPVAFIMSLAKGFYQDGPESGETPSGIGAVSHALETEGQLPQPSPLKATALKFDYDEVTEGTQEYFENDQQTLLDLIRPAIPAINAAMNATKESIQDTERREYKLIADAQSAQGLAISFLYSFDPKTKQEQEKFVPVIVTKNFQLFLFQEKGHERIVVAKVNADGMWQAHAFPKGIDTAYIDSWIKNPSTYASDISEGAQLRTDQLTDDYWFELGRSKNPHTKRNHYDVTGPGTVNGSSSVAQFTSMASEDLDSIVTPDVLPKVKSPTKTKSGKMDIGYTSTSTKITSNE